MGKVKIPGESTFVEKVFFALLILVGMIIIAYLTLVASHDKGHAFSKAVGIVTHVDIVNENISNKWVFVLLGVMGEVVQFYMIYVILEYILEGKFKHLFSGVKYMKKAKKMENHFIVAGGGRVGSHAAQELLKRKENVVVLDKDDRVIEKLRKQGIITIKGDVLDEIFLKELNIEKAKYLICTLGSDSANILLALSARELNPGIRISARANSESAISKLKHAGVTHVVVPSSIGGEELAKVAVRSV